MVHGIPSCWFFFLRYLCAWLVVLWSRFGFMSLCFYTSLIFLFCSAQLFRVSSVSNNNNNIRCVFLCKNAVKSACMLFPSSWNTVNYSFCSVSNISLHFVITFELLFSSIINFRFNLLWLLIGHLFLSLIFMSIFLCYFPIQISTFFIEKIGLANAQV